MSIAKKGVKFTKEHRENISKAKKGKKMNKSSWNKGKHWSKEQHEKIAEINRIKKENKPNNI